MRNYIAYGSHIQRWVMLTKALAMPEQLYEEIQNTRIQYEQQAWGAFADGNYSLFGYYAETWGVLTDILGDNAKNPWRVVSAKINARGHSHSIKFSKIKGLNELPQMCGKTEFSEISNETWCFISPALPRNKRGRPKADGRIVVNAVLFALHNCRSFRLVPKDICDPRRLYDYFAAWYKEGVFKDLLELAPVCPELDAVRNELLAIEMHSLIHGINVVPRLCDIKRVVTNEESNSGNTEKATLP